MLLLDSKNTHLSLRERVRAALQMEGRAAALSAATPEQLKKYASAIGCVTHLAGNRVKYADRVESAGINQLRIYSLASLGNQVQDAQERCEAAAKAIFGGVTVSEDAVEQAMREHLSARGIEYDQTR